MTRQTDSTTDPVERLRIDLALDRARAEARAGRFDAATHTLTGPPSTGDAERARLHLLARVHAQNGELDRADECWARLERDDPSDQAASAGRAAVAAVRGRTGRGRLSPVALGALLAAAVGTAVWLIPAEPAEPVAAPVPAPGRATGFPPAPAAPPVPFDAAPATSLADALTFPGVRAATDGDRVRVTFEQGLYAQSDRLTSQAGARLTEVGRRLADRHGRVIVTGHTVAVPGGPDRGGSAVALARALVAANALSSASGWPLTAFTLATADQADSPFPDATRNRTVTLIVIPDPAER